MAQRVVLRRITHCPPGATPGHPATPVETTPDPSQGSNPVAGRPRAAATAKHAALVLLALGLACAARAESRVVMADDALRVTTVRALRAAQGCRPKVHAAFGVTTAPVLWKQGETSTCNDYGKVAGYTDNLNPGTVYLCLAFLDQTRSLQTLIVLHEELHALGAHDGHDERGHDYEQRMNARILEACR